MNLVDTDLDVDPRYALGGGSGLDIRAGVLPCSLHSRAIHSGGD